MEGWGAEARAWPSWDKCSDGRGTRGAGERQGEPALVSLRFGENTDIPGESSPSEVISSPVLDSMWNRCMETKEPSNLLFSYSIPLMAAGANAGSHVLWLRLQALAVGSRNACHAIAQGRWLLSLKYEKELKSSRIFSSIRKWVGTDES